MSRKKIIQILQNLYNEVPPFTDIFSEDTFYMFVIIFVTSTILIAFILSKYITIKPIA